MNADGQLDRNGKRVVDVLRQAPHKERDAAEVALYEKMRDEGSLSVGQSAATWWTPNSEPLQDHSADIRRAHAALLRELKTIKGHDE